MSEFIFSFSYFPARATYGTRAGKSFFTTSKSKSDLSTRSARSGWRCRLCDVSFDALRRALTLACTSLNVVAADLNELSPHYDMSGASTAVACKIVSEMVIAL